VVIIEALRRVDGLLSSERTIFSKKS
jgi:hypothetical protein